VNLGSTSRDVAFRPRSRGWIGLLCMMCVLCLMWSTSAYAGPHRHKKKKKRGGSRPVPTAPAPTADDGGGGSAEDTPDEPVATEDEPAGPAVSATETGGKNGKPKVFDFTGLDINGRLRTPQLLYFLERANEELERASLEKRSFIPEMVRTLDEERL
jgi:hypothetical protein